MKKKSVFWIVHKSLPKKDKKEHLRWNFWAWMMDYFPKLYWWCDKHLKYDTLPF